MENLALIVVQECIWFDTGSFSAGRFEVADDQRIHGRLVIALPIDLAGRGTKIDASIRRDVNRLAASRRSVGEAGILQIAGPYQVPFSSQPVHDYAPELGQVRPATRQACRGASTTRSHTDSFESNVQARPTPQVGEYLQELGLEFWGHLRATASLVACFWYSVRLKDPETSSASISA